MKIRSVSLNVTHIPDITVTDFSGIEHKNVELPESDQITVELKMASGTEMIEYQKGYSVIGKDGSQKHYSQMNIEYVVAKHVLKIAGLEHETGDIDTGAKLNAGAKSDDLLSVIQLDLFNVIMGKTLPNNRKKEVLSADTVLDGSAITQGE